MKRVRSIALTVSLLVLTAMDALTAEELFLFRAEVQKAAFGEMPSHGFYLATNRLPSGILLKLVHRQTGKSSSAITVANPNTDSEPYAVSPKTADALKLDPHSANTVDVFLIRDKSSRISDADLAKWKSAFASSSGAAAEPSAKTPPPIQPLPAETPLPPPPPPVPPESPEPLQFHFGPGSVPLPPEARGGKADYRGALALPEDQCGKPKAVAVVDEVLPQQSGETRPEKPLPAADAARSGDFPKEVIDTALPDMPEASTLVIPDMPKNQGEALEVESGELPAPEEPALPADLLQPAEVPPHSVCVLPDAVTESEPETPIDPAAPQEAASQCYEEAPPAEEETVAVETLQPQVAEPDVWHIEDEAYLTLDEIPLVLEDMEVPQTELPSELHSDGADEEPENKADEVPSVQNEPQPEWEAPSETEAPESEKPEPAALPSETELQSTREAQTVQAIDSGMYMQVGAFKHWENADRLKKRLEGNFPNLVFIYEREAGIYRVVLGPIRADEKGTVAKMAEQSGIKGFFFIEK